MARYIVSKISPLLQLLFNEEILNIGWDMNVL